MLLLIDGTGNNDGVPIKSMCFWRIIVTTYFLIITKMKTRLIITMALLIAIFAGCKKTTECNTTHWPDPDVTISWDGINDVMTMKKYFDCHDSAIINNFYKPVEVCGYIKKYVGPLRRLDGLTICSDTIMADDNYIKISYLDGAPASKYDSTCMSKLIGFVGHPLGFEGCCDKKLMLYIHKIEKL